MWIVFAPLLGSLVLSRWSRPDDWYTLLQKPRWTPAPWVFAPVWTLLYLAMGWAASRVFAKTPMWSIQGVLFGLQLALNYAWSPVFFRLQNIRAALGVAVALAACVAGMLVSYSSVDSMAAALTVPYLVWACFAAWLTFAIKNMNE